MFARLFCFIIEVILPIAITIGLNAFVIPNHYILFWTLTFCFAFGLINMGYDVYKENGNWSHYMEGSHKKTSRICAILIVICIGLLLTGHLF